MLARLSELDGQFMAGLNDERLSSGVPESQRGDVLDFIGMSGLTRASAEPEQGDLGEGGGVGPVDTAEPLSFFEPGVADVDARMAPPSLDNVSAPHADVIGRGRDGGESPAGNEEPSWRRASEPAGGREDDGQPPADSGPTVMDPTSLLNLDDILEGFAQEPGAAIEMIPSASTARTHWDAADAAGPVFEQDAGFAAAETDGDSVAPSGAASSPEAWDAAELLKEFTEPEPAPMEMGEEPVMDTAGESRRAGDSKDWPAVDEILVGAEPEPAMMETAPPDDTGPAFSPGSNPELSAAEDEYVRMMMGDVPPAAQEPLVNRRANGGSGDWNERGAGKSAGDGLSGAPKSLAEAEELLQALETQPRDERDGAAARSGDGERRAARMDDDLRNEAEAVIYHREVPHRARRSHGSQRRIRRRLIRWVVRACLVLLLGGGAFAAYLYFAPSLMSADMLYQHAYGHFARHDWADAATTFEQYVREHTGEPACADALFQAAFCRMLITGPDYDAESGNWKKALELFTRFVKENPGHVKAARAKTLMGQLNFRLRRFEETIDCLNDPDLRLKDPEAALPALRLLARAQVQLGDFDAAVSAYLQAAAMSGNYSPDVDYDELGDLYRLRAERTEDMTARAEFERLAVEHWTNATRVPGIDPGNKAKITAKRDWLTNHPGSASSPPSGPDAAHAATPAAPPTGAEGHAPAAEAHGAEAPPPAAAPAHAEPAAAAPDAGAPAAEHGAEHGAGPAAAVEPAPAESHGAPAAPAGHEAPAEHGGAAGHEPPAAERHSSAQEPNPTAEAAFLDGAGSKH